VYFCISLLDIIPNIMALYSFRYSSLTSTTLLGSLTVPSTMLFSKCILRKVFSCHHYVGVLLCVLGGTLTVYMDAWGDDDDINNKGTTTTTTTVEYDGQQQQHSFIGDLLAIASAVMYGLGDCVAEYSVKHMDRYEYLGMLGFFGVLITGAIFPWLEHDGLHDLFHISKSAEKLEVAGLMAWFIFSVFLYYVMEARFLVSSDATLLNLSMQSVNLWVFAFTMMTYRDTASPPPTFALSLLFVASGVFLYEVGFCHNNKGICGRPCRRRSRSNSGVEIIREEAPAINYQSLVLG
jgi:solute carrier family 35, member F1/2